MVAAAAVDVISGRTVVDVGVVDVDERLDVVNATMMKHLLLV